MLKTNIKQGDLVVMLRRTGRMRRRIGLTDSASRRLPITHSLHTPMQCLDFSTVLWIRIHRIRIRIQHFNLIRIQGFNDQKLRKKIKAKFFFSF
jgi:hypothetical protein